MLRLLLCLRDGGFNPIDQPFHAVGAAWIMHNCKRIKKDAAAGSGFPWQCHSMLEALKNRTDNRLVRVPEQNGEFVPAEAVKLVTTEY